MHNVMANTKLHIVLPTIIYLLNKSRTKEACLLMKNAGEFSEENKKKKGQETGPLAHKNDKTERARGLGRKRREQRRQKREPNEP